MKCDEEFLSLTPVNLADLDTRQRSKIGPSVRLSHILDYERIPESRPKCDERDIEPGILIGKYFFKQESSRSSDLYSDSPGIIYADTPREIIDAGLGHSFKAARVELVSRPENYKLDGDIMAGREFLFRVRIMVESLFLEVWQPRATGFKKHSFSIEFGDRDIGLFWTFNNFGDTIIADVEPEIPDHCFHTDNFRTVVIRIFYEKNEICVDCWKVDPEREVIRVLGNQVTLRDINYKSDGLVQLVDLISNRVIAACRIGNTSSSHVSMYRRNPWLLVSAFTTHIFRIGTEPLPVIDAIDYTEFFHHMPSFSDVHITDVDTSGGGAKITFTDEEKTHGFIDLEKCEVVLTDLQIDRLVRCGYFSGSKFVFV